MDANSVRIPESGLQKLFTKHGADFGLTGNWKPARAAEMRAAIMGHLNSPNVKAIAGFYRGKPATHVVDPSTALNVIIEPGSKLFIGGWRLSAAQLASVLGSGRLF